MFKKTIILTALLLACIACAAPVQADMPAPAGVPVQTDVPTTENADEFLGTDLLTDSTFSDTEFPHEAIDFEDEEDAEVEPVPEPSSVVLLLAFSGLLLIAGRVRQVWMR